MDRTRRDPVVTTARLDGAAGSAASGDRHAPEGSLRTTRIVFVGAALIAIAALAIPARADTVTNKPVGYSFSLPKSYSNEGKPKVGGNLGFLFFGDYYQLDNIECEDVIPVSIDGGFTTNYRRSVTTYYFPTRTAADIARLKAEQE